MLYINPNKDILDLYPECSKFSTLFELSRKTPNILEIPSLVEEINKNFGLSNQYEVLSLSSEKDVSVFMKEVEEVVDKEDV
ncbi:hypothetical protein ACTPEM_22965, partial [Clostridioides difficile]